MSLINARIFSSKMLWFKAAGLLILAVIAIFYLFWFFTSNGSSEPEQQTKVLPAGNNTVVSVPAAPVKPVVSDKWRLAGRLKRDGQGGLSWLTRPGGCV
ncbi:hypothetical protein [Citrobacter koseri]|uniref:hypothetical protein n=1 Tax=Citrobacter koseri TaxID=545 RepID=UPI001D0EF79D